MTHWTPHQPDVLGLEWPPLFYSKLPLSVGVERGHTFISTEAATVTGMHCVFTDDVGPSHRFHLLHHVYLKGNEVAQDVQETLCPVSYGTGSLSGGASSFPDALNVANDNKRANLQAGGTCEIGFATTGLFTGRRILQLSLDYVLVFDPVAVTGAPAQAEANLYLRNFSTSLTQVYGDITGDQSFEQASIHRVSLGEINMYSVDPVVTADRFPWTYADVASFDSGGNLQLQFVGNVNGFTTHLHFARLRVLHCVENRVAVGGKHYASHSGSGAGKFASAIAGEQQVAVRTPTGSSNWAKANATAYTHVATLAETGGVFREDQDPTLLIARSFSDCQTAGGFPQTVGLESSEIYSPHEGRQMPRGLSNEVTLADSVPTITGLYAGNSSGTAPDGMPYTGRSFLSVYAGNNVKQGIVQRCSAGDCSYEFIRFWARKIGNPGTLTAALASQTATITEAVFDALASITPDGVKQIELRFGTAPTLNNSGTASTLDFSSAGGDLANYWDILVAEQGMISQANNATYEATTGHAAYGPSPTDKNNADVAVMVATEAPQITGFSSTVGSFDVPIVVSTSCNLPVTGGPCQLSSVAYVALAWANSGITNFKWYEVQRSDDFDATFRTIARITDATKTGFYDFEARWGRTSNYRVRVCRLDDFCGVWSATSSIVLTALPLNKYIGVGALILTSNGAWRDSLAYVESFESDRSEQFKFPEVETAVIERFFQRDAQPGFRATERGGVQFTRTVTVNGRGVLSEGGVQLTADRAFTALRDLCWADVPYVCVKDDLGNRWFSTVLVGGGSVKRDSHNSQGLGGIVLAQIDVTEATFDPYPFDFNTTL